MLYESKRQTNRTHGKLLKWEQAGYSVNFIDLFDTKENNLALRETAKHCESEDSRTLTLCLID